MIDEAKDMQADGKYINGRIFHAMADEIGRQRKLIRLVRDDLSLIVAKHAIGKDRTVRRMGKYLHAEKL